MITHIVCRIFFRSPADAGTKCTHVIFFSNLNGTIFSNTQALDSDICNTENHFMPSNTNLSVKDIIYRYSYIELLSCIQSIQFEMYSIYILHT